MCGVVRGGVVGVTANCCGVLRRLRRRGEEGKVRVRLWVDAVCIDQGNVAERIMQVGIMGRIYGRAGRVLVYLGEAAGVLDMGGRPVCEGFLDWLVGLCKEIEDSGCGDEKYRRVPEYSPSFAELSRQVEVYVDAGYKDPTSLVRGFLDVVRRPWWERVWVVQEATLAKRVDVVCGERTVPYELLRCFYKAISNNVGDHRVGLMMYLLGGIKSHMLIVECAQSQSGKEEEAETEDRFVLGRVLQRSQRLKASDKRDHVYGLLEILKMGLRGMEVPPPDYTKSIVELFAEVSIMALTGSLEALSWATNPPSRNKPVSHDNAFEADLPSWVVNWSRPPAWHTPVTMNVYQAAGDSHPNFTISHDKLVLNAKGIFVDALPDVPKADLAAYQNPYISSKGILGYQQSCRVGQLLQSRSYPYPTGEDYVDVLWRTLCWNVDAAFQYPADASLRTPFEHFQRALFSGRGIEEIERAILHDDASGFNDICIHSMPLCITETGLLASVPWCAEAGDVVAVLAGGELPVVLRQIVGGEGGHTLVGACYVHGIMDGSKFPADEEELVWITIV
ncbi:heterokaryon incompatibility protein-domain-containing protein [Xylariaceae sp. FL1272]|nr:heterokaryon incompatibility protein-domain-containing protein [Xylariaceae sp. FL1272]